MLVHSIFSLTSNGAMHNLILHNYDLAFSILPFGGDTHFAERKLILTFAFLNLKIKFTTCNKQLQF